MSKQVELSFKNKAVKMWLILMVPNLFVQICLTQFTEVPRFIPACLPAISLLVFFSWFYWYKRNEQPVV